MIVSMGARRWVLISEVLLLMVGWTVLQWSADVRSAANPLGPLSYTKEARLPVHRARGAAGEILGRLPLSFEANEGQQDPAVRFSARGNGCRILLKDDGPSFVFREEDKGPPKTISIRLPHQNRPHVTGVEKLPGITNYFVGRNRSGWKTQIANYAKVRYEHVFPGIDVAYYGRGHDLEYDLIAEPGADTSNLQFLVSGIERPEDARIDATGDLILRVSDAELKLHRPVAYQQARSGTRRRVQAHYSLSKPVEPATKDHQLAVSIQVENYDQSQQLIVDPVVTFSTYLGGTSIDNGTAIAVDSGGNSYIAGWTISSDFPTVNPFQGSLQQNVDSNAFITKINAAGTAILYSTYLGGSGSGNGNITNGGEAFGIAVDSSGNAYVVGDTGSNDFPVTSGAFNATCTTCPSIFITKLDSTGSQLVYSTYFGGTPPPNEFGESAGAVAVDSSGSVYVTGANATQDFPTTPGAFQTTGQGVFVSKLNPSGSALSYSTLIGPGFGAGIKVDPAGNAYVTGYATSPAFPTTPGAFQTTYHTSSAKTAFVTELNSSGSALVYPSLLGGSYFDQAFGIGIDAAGNAYVAGQTLSTDFPVANAYQAALNGTSNAFVSKLDPSGTSLVYSTYLGGGNEDWAAGIAVDPAGDAYITGTAGSKDFPLVGALQTIYGGGTSDAFLTVMSPSGNPTFSTFLGGGNTDQGYGIAVDSSGNAYVAGTTSSVNFPALNAIQPALSIGPSCTVGCSTDAFVTKFAVSQATPSPDFSITSPAASQSISSGQTASYQVTVNPIGGFTQPIAFTCSGQLLTSCTLPSSWHSTGLSTLSATVTVVTSPQGSITINPSGFSDWHALAGFGVLVMCVWLLKKRVRRTVWVTAAIPLLSLVILSACGSGSGSGGGGSSGTQPGTYAIKITGTSGSLSHVLNLTLTVN